MPRHPWIPESVFRWLRGEKKKRLNFELDEEAWDYLEATAREEGMSIDEMARWMLRGALEARSAAEANLARWELLSTRERDVATLYSQGMDMGEVAKELVISKETVKTHLYNAVRKLGLKKVDELRGVMKRN